MPGISGAAITPRPLHAFELRSPVLDRHYVIGARTFLALANLELHILTFVQSRVGITTLDL